VVGIPIVVDKVTGETTIQQRLSVESVPLMEALDKHHLAVFVRAREGYAWWFLQRDFDQVARMAVPSVFADYNRQFEGETALQKKLAGARSGGSTSSAFACRRPDGAPTPGSRRSPTRRSSPHRPEPSGRLDPTRRQPPLRVPAEGARQGEGPDREPVRLRRHGLPIRPRNRFAALAAMARQ
jgi:hypothetical protein